MRNILRFLQLLPRTMAIGVIRLYQTTLSPDHGPLRALFPYGCCMFTPTCSEYGKLVIAERGVVVGGMLLVRRLASCHPWKKPDDAKIMEATQCRPSETEKE